MSRAVVVENLSRHFGSFCAVDSISFEVEAGEIFGFLGANGAGKSTTIRMLCGILPPDGGRAIVLGMDVARDPAGVKRSIGYMSQRFSLYGDLTVEENINFAAGIRGLSGNALRRRRDRILEETGLLSERHMRTDKLPGGVKQRLALSCSLIHDPQLIFLDEPTSGVDPASRHMFWNLIREMKERGRTVFVTSHYMDEVEQCDRVALMNRGRIDALDSPAGLRSEVLPGPVLEIHPGSSGDIGPLLNSWKSRSSEIVRIDPFGRGYHVVVQGKAQALQKALRKAGCTVRTVPPSLEDVFVYIIGRSQE